MIELMPHNKKAVAEIISAYISGARRVAYLSGVGTGKSAFCAAEWPLVR